LVGCIHEVTGEKNFTCDCKGIQTKMMYLGTITRDSPIYGVIV
jgi:hypothetical protein